jgi:prolipoprotein diacylglyceryltransferase
LFGLLWLLNRKDRRLGVLTLTFGLFYGLCRVLEDSLRIDKRFGPFTGSQWTALTVATLSALTLVWWALHPRDDEPAAPLPGERIAGEDVDDPAVGRAPVSESEPGPASSG